MSVENSSHPPQENVIPSPQSPRDIRLKQIQARNAHLQSELNQLEIQRQNSAAELRIAIAQPVENLQKEEEEEEITRNSDITVQHQDFDKEEKEEEVEEGEDQTQLDTTLAAAQSIVQKHIRLLHEYNAIKDIGQGLFGLIADGRGVRLREIHEEFGVDDSD